MSKNYELSIIIPSRSEEFLKNTVEDILKNKRAKTEIIVVLDGEWSKPPLIQHPDVNVIYVPEAIGQRRATNIGVNLARGKYIAKSDAHCSFDQGFDRKLLDGFKERGDNNVMVPIMRNLWAFDWKCLKCGKKWYQGPTPSKCKETNYKGTGKPCDSTKFKKKMLWIGKRNPQSKSYCFDSSPHFQYFNEYKRTDKYKEELKTGFTETMSLQGSFFAMTRKKYLSFAKDREAFGSWGNEGIEIACREWLTKGRVLVNQKTWYAHLFRTHGDFSFPYPQSGNDVSRTKARIRKQIWLNKIPYQKYPLSWLVKRFWHVKGWTEKDLANLEKDELKTDKSGIYLITCSSNKKIYIGSAEKLNRRIKAHQNMLNRNDHENEHLQNAWNKYGKDSFKFEILRFCLKENLLKYEQKFIDRYKKEIGWNNMFNINPDAKSWLGRKHTLESIQKMRESSRGKPAWNKGIPRSAETKEKISIANRGNKVWNKGLTKETDSRIKESPIKGKHIWANREHPRSMLGKTPTEETRQKISNALKGRPKTAEQNRKNSEAHKGKIFSEEHRRNISIAQKKNLQPRNEKNGRFISREGKKANLV